MHIRKAFSLLSLAAVAVAGISTGAAGTTASGASGMSLAQYAASAANPREGIRQGPPPKVDRSTQEGMESQQGEDEDGDGPIITGMPSQSVSFAKISNPDNPLDQCEWDKGFWMPRTLGTSSSDTADTGVKTRMHLVTLVAPSPTTSVPSRPCVNDYAQWQTIGVAKMPSGAAFVEVRFEDYPYDPNGRYAVSFDDENGHSVNRIYYSSWPSLTPTVKLLSEKTCSGTTPPSGSWSACIDWNGDGVFELNVGTIGPLSFTGGEIWAESASGGETGHIHVNDSRDVLQYQTAGTSWKDWPGVECANGHYEQFYFHQSVPVNAFTIDGSSANSC